MRIAMTLSYDGSCFFGFQNQKNTKETVEYNLIDALQSVGITTSIVGAGRTDRGVHALRQVISFDIPTYWQNLEKLTTELNRKLKHIKIKSIVQKKDDFHARFDAKKREYLYIFKSKPLSVFEENYFGFYENFDTKRLQEALCLFEGKHDFALFCKKSLEQNGTLCEIFQSHYTTYKDNHIIKISANRFLRSQIRLIVHTAMLYATNKATKEEIQKQIERDTRYFTTLASPSGLYLSKILY